MCLPLATVEHPASSCAANPPPVAALQTEELTADLAVSLALHYNRRLAAIYDQLGVAKAHLWQAALLPNPIASFIYKFSTVGSVSDKIEPGIIQNFLEILLIPQKKKMASLELEMTSYLVAKTALEVATETKLAYYNFLAKRVLLALKRELAEVAQAAEEATFRLFLSGNVRQIDLALQELRYQEAWAHAAEAERELVAAQEMLNAAMGLWGGQKLWQTPCSLPEVTPVCLPCDLENGAIASNIDLAIAKVRLLASSAGLSLERVKTIFPTFDAGVVAEREEGIWYVGPAFAVAIPLFDLGQAKAMAMQKEIFSQWNLLTAAAVEIRNFAFAMQSNLAHSIEQVQIYEQTLIPTAEQRVHEILLQNQAMQIGVVELLIAKQAEIAAKIRWVELQSEYWAFRTQIETLYRGLRWHR